MADSRLARAVPFEMMGPDYVLRFRTADLVALREKYGLTWMQEIEGQLSRSDAEMVRECVRLGVKGPGGFTIPDGIDYEDLPFAPAQAVRPISDALTCAIVGTTYADLIEQRAADTARVAAVIDEAGADAEA